MSEWISVKNRLPEEGVQVLTYFMHAIHPKYNLDYTVPFPENSPPYIWACTLQDDMDKVTHWMPLPEPPKELKMNGWFSVKDKLPDPWDVVWIYWRDREVLLGCRVYEGRYAVECEPNEGWYSFEDEKCKWVNWWMPVDGYSYLGPEPPHSFLGPEPPKE